MHVSALNVAWLAGLVEGEGCVSIKRKKRTANGASGDTIHLHVGMCDRDVIARAAELLGAKVLGPYAHSGDDGFERKVQWRVVATGSLAAAWMMTLYPFMGERRRMAMRDCLLFWRSLSKSGRRFLPYRLGHELHGTRYGNGGYSVSH